MNTPNPVRAPASFALLAAAAAALFGSSGCSSLSTTSSLEDDEWYLGRSEAFITDEASLAFAYREVEEAMGSGEDLAADPSAVGEI